MEATGTFTLQLDANGKVTRTHVDPWTGDQTLLSCAAHAFEGIAFVKPRASNGIGNGTVISRVTFNPRQGTK